MRRSHSLASHPEDGLHPFTSFQTYFTNFLLTQMKVSYIFIHPAASISYSFSASTITLGELLFLWRFQEQNLFSHW